VNAVEPSQSEQFGTSIAIAPSLPHRRNNIDWKAPNNSQKVPLKTLISHNAALPQYQRLCKTFFRLHI
jgi:hypothetical protein